MITPRFNRLAFFQKLIKRSTRDRQCRTLDDHEVLDSTIAKRIKDRNYRFIESCIYCHKTLGFDCTYDDNGDLKISKAVCNNLLELQRYFGDINNNTYYEPHEAPHEDDHSILVEACKVCQGRSLALTLCQEHLLEALLHLKFKDTNLDRAITEIRYNNDIPNIVAQGKITMMMRQILTGLKGDELIDFIQVFPSIVAKLKVVRS